LVNQINRAAGLGIRVAFGFLDASSSLQDPDVLSAIMHSGGRYFTIQNYNASKAFIDGIIVNGLTKNDNPKGASTTLLAGLDASHFISGSETQTMTYSPRSKEQLTFDVQSVNAGVLSVQVVSGRKTLTTGQSSSYSDTLSVVAPSTDKIDVKVTANNAKKDSIFVVGVTSNLPPKNCTVGVGPISTHHDIPHIVGGSIGGVVALLLIGGTAYLIYKYCHRLNQSHGHPAAEQPSYTPDGPKHFPTSTVQEVPTPNPNQSSVPWFKFPAHPPPKKQLPRKMTQTEDKGKPSNKDDDTNDLKSEVSAENDASKPEDPHQRIPDDSEKLHIRRLGIRTYGNEHHHHIPPQHPCFDDKCALAIAAHVHENSDRCCTCVDPKCKLNSGEHKCRDENMLHICAGPENDPGCPLTDPEIAKVKKAERDELVRKYRAQDMALQGLKTGASAALRAAF
jgi:hypothetical protein